MQEFATGFVSHFEYPPPRPWGYVDNYPVLRTPEGKEKFTAAMKKQVEAGKVIGGPGQSSRQVDNFFGRQGFYCIPCSAVEKNGDPYGRIVHDYGFYTRGSYSINAAHSCTRVVYNNTKQVAAILDGVVQFIKADLAAGYRQFGAHPVDWRFQVYSNGPNEHYIDLACPFGKTNSSLEFCPPVALFARSAATRYSQQFNVHAPVLETHVDDIYGGFKTDRSEQRAIHFRQWMCDTGNILTVKFNMKKTPMPSKQQVILGRLQDSSQRRVRTSLKKIKKYQMRIANMLSGKKTSCESIESLHGCLRYVASVEPYGIPFLTQLIALLNGRRLRDRKQRNIRVPWKIKRMLGLQHHILAVNKGVSLDYILDRLPRSEYDIFSDASTTWGIGGCCGRFYFATPWCHLKQFDTGLIAQKELFAAVVALFCFRHTIRGRLTILHTDNTNAHDWLMSGRSPHYLGNNYLMAFELIKYVAECKISVCWIPSAANRTADALSRGRVPNWLLRHGERCIVDYKQLKRYLDDPMEMWRKTLG